MRFNKCWTRLSIKPAAPSWLLQNTGTTAPWQPAQSCPWANNQHLFHSFFTVHAIKCSITRRKTQKQSSFPPKLSQIMELLPQFLSSWESFVFCSFSMMLLSTIDLCLFIYFHLHCEEVRGKAELWETFKFNYILQNLRCWYDGTPYTHSHTHAHPFQVHKLGLEEEVILFQLRYLNWEIPVQSR